MLGIARPHSPFLVILGIAVIVFAFLPNVNFFIRLPGWHREKKKALPQWSSRAWFIAAGLVLLYLGLWHR